MFEAFAIGPFLIWTHAVFLILGVLLSTEFFLRLAQSANLSLMHFRTQGFWYVTAFLLSGRLAAIVADYRVYIRDPLRVFIVWDGGFSLLGGAIGVGCVLYSFTRASRATFLQWLDVLFPATMFALAFDWFGRFAAGKAYGKPTDVIWGVTYDAMNVRYTVPIHPVQLYYACIFLLLTFVLLIVRKASKRAGAETLVGIILASVSVFFLEWFRGDFGIPVFATRLDFLVLLLLFISLGIFVALELRLGRVGFFVYSGIVACACIGYLLLRSTFAFDTFELRFSQFLAVLALLGTIVYVVAHRRKYPYL
ncbi:hypothetical protein A3D11_02570 [Candidatus Peribacteria bacterium RIFCSPHIGHO2_02_FULL_49_16]|nr:MAG: hypothetical protein A2880_01990 [Candidatus Peribacteria bacterium RIFCSPHIGHO2_01_FULL_49_38]OGJ58481.1 MAG: hypothetical protein A3D11_02570 [Candidatus Peribacteria bacterium RIFCSPHIGHO2_02_FULL_49_16]